MNKPEPQLPEKFDERLFVDDYGTRTLQVPPEILRDKINQLIDCIAYEREQREKLEKRLHEFESHTHFYETGFNSHSTGQPQFQKQSAPQQEEMQRTDPISNQAKKRIAKQRYEDLTRANQNTEWGKYTWEYYFNAFEDGWKRACQYYSIDEFSKRFNDDSQPSEDNKSDEQKIELMVYSHTQDSLLYYGVQTCMDSTKKDDAEAVKARLEKALRLLETEETMDLVSSLTGKQKSYFLKDQSQPTDSKPVEIDIFKEDQPADWKIEFKDNLLKGKYYDSGFEGLVASRLEYDISNWTQQAYKRGKKDGVSFSKDELKELRECVRTSYNYEDDRSFSIELFNKLDQLINNFEDK